MMAALLWMYCYRLIEVTPLTGPPRIGQHVTLLKGGGDPGRIVAVLPPELTSGVYAALVLWEGGLPRCGVLEEPLSDEDFGIRATLRRQGLEELAEGS